MSTIFIDANSTYISYPEDDHLIIAFDDMLFHLYYQTISNSHFLIYFKFQNYQFATKCISNSTLQEALPSKSSTRLGLHDIITIFNTQIDFVKSNLYRLVMHQKIANTTLTFDLELITTSVCMKLIYDMSLKLNEKDDMISKLSSKVARLTNENGELNKKFRHLINEYNKWGEKMNATKSAIKSEIVKLQKRADDQNLLLQKIKSQVDTTSLKEASIIKSNSSNQQPESALYDIQLTNSTLYKSFNSSEDQFPNQPDLNTSIHNSYNSRVNSQKSHSSSQSHSFPNMPISSFPHSHNSAQTPIINYDWNIHNPNSDSFNNQEVNKNHNIIINKANSGILHHNEIKQFNTTFNKNELDYLMSKVDLTPEVSSHLPSDKYKKSNANINKPLNYLNEEFNSELSTTTILSQNSATLKCLVHLNEYEYAYGDWYGKIIILNKETHKVSDFQFDKKDFHSNWVNEMITADKSNFMISASSDNTLKVWNTETYKLERTLIKHSGWVLTIAQMNSFMIASGSNDKSILIWNYLKGEVLACIRQHNESVNGLAYCNLDRLLSTSSDKTIRLWAVGDKPSEVARINENHEVYSVILLTKTTCAVTLKVGDINVWEIVSKALLYTLKGHSKQVYTIIKLSSSLIASAGEDRFIYIWDINKKKIIKNLKGHISEVFSLLKLSDSEILSCGADTTLRLWK